MIGKPLHVDKTTASRRRITYARICIEVDASEEWITDFELESSYGKPPISVKVEYQWTPSRCSECKCFGHNCQVKNRINPKNITPTISQQWAPVQNVPSNQNVTANLPIDSLDDGQWNIVRRKDKGKGKAQIPKEDVQGLRPSLDQGIASTASQQVRTSNSFNALIPFVYEVDDSASLQECNEAQFDDVAEDEEGYTKGTKEEGLLNPMSSRQKKKAAKILFSGNRPKGRHRS